MRLRPVVSRMLAVAPLGLLTACVVQGSSDGAAESAADEFFKFILILVIVGIVGAIIWALVLAGGVAAILAGIRRVKKPPQHHQAAQSLPPSAPPPPPPTPGEPPPPIPAGSERPQGPDTFGIALIVFGAVLVFAAGPFVFGDNGFGTHVRIPLPLLIVAGVLVAVGVRRRR